MNWHLHTVLWPTVLVLPEVIRAYITQTDLDVKVSFFHDSTISDIFLILITSKKIILKS